MRLCVCESVRVLVRVLVRACSSCMRACSCMLACMHVCQCMPCVRQTCRAAAFEGQWTRAEKARRGGEKLLAAAEVRDAASRGRCLRQ